MSEISLTPKEAPAKSAVVFADTVPCNWTIIRDFETDIISATNSNSGETFEGTIAEFNAALRG